MARRKRSRLSPAQKTEIWKRWKAGQSLHEVLPFVYQERDGTGGTTDVGSPWSHYVRCPLEEIGHHGNGLSALWGRGLLKGSPGRSRSSSE